MRNGPELEDRSGLTSPAELRSRIMRSVKGKGNKSTELALIRILRQWGIVGWRRHLSLPGTPDFAFPADKVAIFVDGCFWHGCPVCYTAPKEHAKYWADKVTRNRRRDRRMDWQLRKQGWTVIHIWEHALRRPGLVARRLTRALERKRLKLRNKAVISYR